MASCTDCLHVKVCQKTRIMNSAYDYAPKCEDFKYRSQFVELKSAEWIEDEDMYGDPIFRCSNCEARFVLEEGTPEDNEYYYCPNCGAKMDKQALKEREKHGSSDCFNSKCDN